MIQFSMYTFILALLKVFVKTRGGISFGQSGRDRFLWTAKTKSAPLFANAPFEGEVEIRLLFAGSFLENCTSAAKPLVEMYLTCLVFHAVINAVPDRESVKHYLGIIKRGHCRARFGR